MAASRGETSKATPKLRAIKAIPKKVKASPAGVTKKTTTMKNPEIPKAVTSTGHSTDRRLRTSTVPKVATPKPKENRSVPVPSSTNKSVKKSSWKRRPKPAHSGVPLPEKMKRLRMKLLENPDCSF